MRAFRSLLPLIAGLAALAPGLAAAQQAALVEEIAADGAGIRFMDYLTPGQVVKLPAGGHLVLNYLRSCTRETVTGGTVTIGTEESRVVGGEVRRETVECDGGFLMLTQQQAAKSGVFVFRKASKTPGEGDGTMPTLYGTSPLIDMPAGGRLKLERVDAAEAPRTIELKKLKDRAFPYDCAQAGIRLAAGGTYRLTAEGRELQFRIAPAAKDGVLPPVMRLLRL